MPDVMGWLAFFSTVMSVFYLFLYRIVKLIKPEPYKTLPPINGNPAPVTSTKLADHKKKM